MSITFPMFLTLITFIFIFPQFNLPVDTTYLWLVIPAFFLVPFIIAFLSIRRIIIDPNKEEAELHTTDLVKVFASKQTLMLIALWVALAAGTIIFEMSTGDKGLTIRKVHYSTDKILIAMIIPLLLLALDETINTYHNALKKFKPEDKLKTKKK